MEGIDGSTTKQWLSAAERVKIKSLKLYRGGNAFLWILHQLDIRRKHERLITVTVEPALLNVVAIGAADYGPAASEIRRIANETTLVEVSADAPDPQIQATLRVTFDEPDFMAPLADAFRTLHKFASLAEAIVKLFDIP